MRQGLAAHRATGAEIGRPRYLAVLAEAYGTVGWIDEGQKALEEALVVMHKSGERFYEAELYRLKGQLTLQQSSVQGLASRVQTKQKAKGKGQKAKGKGQKAKIPSTQYLAPSTPAEAEACFLKAIEVARRQQAKSWELRATVSLARLWQQQGKHHAARNMLADIYNWFTEGFDTKDLQEAKALLEELNR
jgi:predicted ATPase